MLQISAYCLNWHITTSPAFHALLVEPLRFRANITLNEWNAGLLAHVSEKSRQPVIFCQIKPPEDMLAQAGARVVWIPMWDQIRHLKTSQWDRLPKSLRVVAFSDAVASRAEAAGLTTLRLRYFKNPEEFPAAGWDHGRVMLYWNRRGLFQAGFLKKMCEALAIDVLIFRNFTDPKAKVDKGASYSLPARLGHTVVRVIPGALSHKEYLAILRETNVHLASRKYEGVGMTSLEALASGCAVFGQNAPTLSEYVTHGETGYLFTTMLGRWTRPEIALNIRRRLAPFGVKPGRVPDRAIDSQNWSEMRSLNLIKLGVNARAEQAGGYDRWRSQIKEYAQFVLDW